MLQSLIFTYRYRDETLANARDCEDFRAYCNEKDAVWLRFACSLSCGCSDPLSGLFERKGCQQACLSVRKKLMEEVDCEDPTPEQLRVDPHFNNFIEHFDPFYDLRLSVMGDTMSEGIMNKTALRELGCGFTRDVTKVFPWATEGHLAMICGADPVKTNSLSLLDTDKVTFRAFCPESCFCSVPHSWTEECPASCRRGSDGSKVKTRGCLGGICGGNPPEGLCSSLHSSYYSGMFRSEACPSSISYVESICCPNGSQPTGCDRGLCVHVFGGNSRVIENVMVPHSRMTCKQIDTKLKEGVDEYECLYERLVSAPV